MKFVIRALDGADEGAPARRLAARPAHLEQANAMIKDGRLLYAAALLNDNDETVGSLLVCKFSTRDKLEQWLSIEPYVIAKVWQSIDIHPCTPVFGKAVGA
ncbi:MAG: hypothetical protein D4R84_03205 [Rhodocyclaceae bacterium]|nr:MAG: hypothetical protein D4R84_03205 [Rhodocyclaceae bacterium]